MPDRDYDIGGCFSGTALTYEDGRHMLMYTGCQPDSEDQQGRGLQIQCIAFGDGVNYEKYEGNPVIAAEMLPEGGDPYEFAIRNSGAKQTGHTGQPSPITTGQAALRSCFTEAQTDWRGSLKACWQTARANPDGCASAPTSFPWTANTRC